MILTFTVNDTAPVVVEWGRIDSLPAVLNDGLRQLMPAISLGDVVRVTDERGAVLQRYRLGFIGMDSRGATPVFEELD